MRKKNFLEDLENGIKFSGYARILKKKNGYSKISFWRIRFRENDIQLILQKEKIFNFDEVRRFPLGSLFFFKGIKEVSSNGEHSLYANFIKLEYEGNRILHNKLSSINCFSKSNSRILDIIANKHLFDCLSLFSYFLGRIRIFLMKNDFREIITGILQDYFEGGLAEPFQAQCKVKGKPLYLSLTSELKLKRLMTAGFEKVYEIVQSFRNEGVDKIHLPEFTLLELYATNQDYNDMMSLLEKMIKEILVEANNEFLSSKESKVINFSHPFVRKTFNEACFEILGVKGEECDIKWLARNYPKMFFDGMDDFTWTMKLVDKILVPNFVEPTFLIDIPSGISPFAKKHSQNEKLSESAFFIAKGINIATISTSENDAKKISLLLSEQSKKTGRPVNNDYLRVLDLGLLQTAGIGFGLNRFFMLFQEGEKNARETFSLPVF